jgi:hypothetical protein
MTDSGTGYVDLRAHAKAMLAASATFQDLVGAESAAEAEAFVYMDHKADEAPPYARIIISPYIRDSLSLGTFSESGTVRFVITLAIDLEEIQDGGNPPVELIEEYVAQQAGEIVDDLADLSHTAGYLMLARLQADPPQRNPREAKSGLGEYWNIVIVADLASG